MKFPKYSIIIPVYKNEANIAPLFEELKLLSDKLDQCLEVVFVIDGSPDNSYALIQKQIVEVNFSTQVLVHSKNFGSFPAIRTGLIHARGQYFAVMAADLQEPPELVLNFFELLINGECDIAIGERIKRNDSLLSQLNSKLFWMLYKKLVVPEMPDGGVDIFGCNNKFRNELIKLEESRTSLVALIFWLGFERRFVKYERKKRLVGKSAWTLRKKIDYMLDSIFSFTDYPIRFLMWLGSIGMTLSIILSLVALISKLAGFVEVPGYTTIVLLTLFFGGMNFFGLGLVGTYAWRAYENSKQRPLSVIRIHNIDGDNHEK